MPLPTITMPSTPNTEHSASLQSANRCLCMQWPTTVFCKQHHIKVWKHYRHLRAWCILLQVRPWNFGTIFIHYHVTTIKRWYMEKLSPWIHQTSTLWVSESKGNRKVVL